MFIHKGNISFNFKDALFHEFRDALETKELDIRAKKKYLFIFEECVSNVLDYYKKNSALDKNFLLSFNFLNNETGKCILETKNYINNADCDSIKNKFLEITTKNKQQLDLSIRKNIYSNNTSNNAGIGLMQIAKKFDAEINFNIEKFDSDFSYLTLHIIA